jgi:hypothetical protein
MGGRPELQNPVYFFLGRHRGFEEKFANKGYMISLESLSSHVVTFSYGDSMFVFDEGYRRQSGEKYQNHLCTKIYRLEELSSLLNHEDYPKDEPLAIEAQLWVKPNPEKVSILE